MTSLSRDDSERFGLSTGVEILLALIAGISSLWFSRSYYFNADRVGWGIPSADRNQSLFWWGTAISVAVSLLLAIMAAIRSGRFRLAFVSAGAITSALMFMSRWLGLRYVTWALLPAIFPWIMAFGVHAGPGKWVGFLWVFGVNTVFYTAMIGGAMALLRGRKGLRGEAKS